MRNVLSILNILCFLLFQNPGFAQTNSEKKWLTIWTASQMAHHMSSKENAIRILKSRKASPQIEKLIESLQSVKNWPKITNLNDHLMVTTETQVIDVRPVSPLENTYEINGRAFTFKFDGTVQEEIALVEKFLSKKKAFKFSIFPEAQAQTGVGEGVAAVAVVIGVIAIGITAGTCALSGVSVSLNKMFAGGEVQPRVQAGECKSSLWNWPMDKERITGMKCKDSYDADRCHTLEISYATVNSPQPKKWNVTLGGAGELQSVYSGDGSPIPEDLKPYLDFYGKVGSKKDSREDFVADLKKGKTPLVRTEKATGAH